MSRKAFILWGLAIIQLAVTAHAIFMYLSLSKSINSQTIGGGLIDITRIFVLIGFCIILYLRFKTVGRRKRILALCLPFLIVSGFVGAYFMLGVYMADVFNAHDRYFNVIKEWHKTGDSTLPVSWSISQRLDYIFVACVPVLYMGYWGFFALLWFGSLDPRTPSKNRIVQFFKTGFTEKFAPNLSVKRTHFQEITA